MWIVLWRLPGYYYSLLYMDHMASNGIDGYYMLLQNPLRIRWNPVIICNVILEWFQIGIQKKSTTLTTPTTKKNNTMVLRDYDWHPRHTFHPSFGSSWSRNLSLSPEKAWRFLFTPWKWWIHLRKLTCCYWNRLELHDTGSLVGTSPQWLVSMIIFDI